MISSGDTVIGALGQIHPLAAENYGLGETFAAELDFLKLLDCREAERRYVPLPKFPAIARDIALVCEAAIPVASLTDCIRRGGGALLREVALFDIYTGSPIPEGKKSAAFSLKLRSDEKTLTDEDADGRDTRHSRAPPKGAVRRHTVKAPEVKKPPAAARLRPGGYLSDFRLTKGGVIWYNDIRAQKRSPEPLYAGIAQPVEQRIRNAQVVSSSLTTSSK